MMILNKDLSLDEMKDFRRTVEIDDEARASDDYIVAELEKIRNVSQEEFDAATNKAYEEYWVIYWEACEANRKAKKALKHLQVIMGTREMYSLIGVKKIRGRQSLKEANEEFYAALQEWRAASHKVERSTRLIKAMSRAGEKRPMTDCEAYIEVLVHVHTEV